MDDLKERLREPNGTDGMSTRRLRKEAADRIEALEAELAARDGVIVAWLREQADKGDVRLEKAIRKEDEKHQRPELWAAGVIAIRKAADAIEAGEYAAAKEEGEA